MLHQNESQDGGVHRGPGASRTGRRVLGGQVCVSLKQNLDKGFMQVAYLVHDPRKLQQESEEVRQGSKGSPHRLP